MDMLVKLYDLKDDPNLYVRLLEDGVRIIRVLPPDCGKVVDFVRRNFSDGWANECRASFFNHPMSCYIAVRGKEIVGFACYDATAKDFFGPTGVLESERGKGIGKALLLKCLFSMKEEGYAYAIIGWVSDAKVFYEKCVNAIEIEDSFPGVYERLI